MHAFMLVAAMVTPSRNLKHVSSGVGNFLGGSIYHMQMHADNIPFLPNQPPPALHGMLAKAVMATNVLTVSPMESRDNLKNLLEVCSHA